MSSAESTPKEKPYHSGHDIKSLAINLATTTVFLLPFAAYLYTEHLKIEIGVTVGVLLLAYLLPPMGWMRPHPYSDFPSNRLKTKQT